MAAEYPKKYWWVILIVVPIAIAIVGIFPDLMPRGDGKSNTPQIIIFQATPSTVEAGDTAVLQWETRHANQVRLNGRLVTLDGNLNVTPLKKTTYTLIALDEAGKTDSETLEIDVASKSTAGENNKQETHSQPEYYPPARVKLRSEPRTLSDEEVTQMLAEQDFYAEYLNPSGKGFPNEFEIRHLDDQEVIVDYATLLMWNRQGSATTHTWYRAGDYVIELNRARYAGYADWRLPTIEEIASLMERAPAPGSGHIDPIFRLPAAIDCWTGDRKASATEKDTAWMAGFSYGGFVHGGSAKNRACVLAVRSAG